MAAIPAMFPCIMIGNIILVLAVALLRSKFGKKAGLPVSIVIGAVLKALFMGILISLIILPNMLPAKMQPMLHVLQLQFSVTQLITALIGGVYAIIIIAVLVIPLLVSRRNPTLHKLTPRSGLPGVFYAFYCSQSTRVLFIFLAIRN